MKKNLPDLATSIKISVCETKKKFYRTKFINILLSKFSFSYITLIKENILKKIKEFSHV